jgi:PPOX class probable F420-dependent enzyme
MPSRRDQIKMTDDELRVFLATEKIMTCATIGPNGRPHLMPLWFVTDGETIRAWTFAKSQKAKNLERDPHATLQIEAGVEYQELRGVMLECDVEVERDADKVADLGIDIFTRYGPGPEGEVADETRQMVMKQAEKRIGMTFRPTRTVSWDHRKLGGVY